MSRGGRGGFRGGGGAGRGKMGGQDLPWEYDPDLEITTKPSELFPQTNIPFANPPRRTEKIAVARYRALRARVHEGPLYTVLGNTVRVGKTGPPPSASFDPFEGMPTYAQRYKKQRRRIPRLDSRPYVLRFFPEELHALLDPDQGKTNGATTKKRKKLKIAQTTRYELQDLEEEEERGDDDDEDEDEKDTEENEEEEEVDDDYEDDESEMDDYNAEQYFDNGEDDNDFGGGDDGGDDGGFF